MSKKRDIATVLLGITAALILWITILSREMLMGTPIKYNLFHAFVSFMKEIQRGKLSINFVGNIIAFIPVGILVPLVIGKKRKCVLLIGFGFSLIIEIIQLISARGCFDPDDIILNTLGTAIGYVLCRSVVHKKTVDAESI